MDRSTIPLLGYALLGLLQQKGRSGYDLRKVFAETAMGNYSSSPGAIYPALERLVARGLIRGTVEEKSGLRRRCVYRLTARGGGELKSWLARPIQQSDVMRGADELMLRFTFMDQVLGPAACIGFLGSFRSALTPYIAELESYHAANNSKMPLSGRLALESGILGYRSLRDWTSHALRTYRQLQTANSAAKPKPSKGGLQ